MRLALYVFFYNYNQKIVVNGGVHHRSVLSTLLIILIIWCRDPIDSRSERAIKVEPDKLEVVASFYYLSAMVFVERGCEVAVSNHDQKACKTFSELLSVLTSRHPSKKSCAHGLTRRATSSMSVKLGR